MKTAVIGIGIIGNVHLDALTRGNACVSALCDIDPLKTAEANERFGLGANTYTDYREMLAKEKPDVVHICTPHYLHKEMILAALAAGANVLTEKPLCISEDGIKEILAAEKEAEKHGQKLGVCFQNRFNDASVYVKKFLQGKKVLSASAEVLWHRDSAYYGQAAWRGKWATEGGGVAINQAIHTLDLLQWFLGFPQSLTAVCENRAHKDCIEVEDTVSATLFVGKNGEIPVRFDASTCAERDNPVKIRIVCENTTIEMLGSKVYVDGTLVSEEEMQHSVYGKASYGNGHGKLFDAFYTAVQEKKPFPITGEEGAKALKLVLAAYRSNGEKITF